MEGNIFVILSGLFLANLFIEIESEKGNYTAPVYCTAQPNYPIIQGRGAGLIGSSYKWKTNFNILIHEDFDFYDRIHIYQAKYMLQQHVPCLEFNILSGNSTPTGDYVYITKGIGCSSYIGRQGGSQQMILQSPGCMSVGTIIHEMLHALGFEHEHQRPDRDDYITINYENIRPGYERNFQKQSWSRVSIYNEPYNYKSIMQYDSKTFNKNGKATLTKKNGNHIKRSRELQQSDIRQLKAMYPCYD